MQDAQGNTLVFDGRIAGTFACSGDCGLDLRAQAVASGGSVLRVSERMLFDPTTRMVSAYTVSTHRTSKGCHSTLELQA